MGALKHSYIAQKLNSKKIIEAKNTKELNLYLQMFFEEVEEKEYISLFTNKDKKRWSIKAKNLKDITKFAEEEDFYCSVNTFYSPKAISKYTKTLRAVVLDLDYYNISHLRDLSAENVIKLMEMDVDFIEPSFYVSSGRGLYGIWLLEKTYATTKSKRFWRNLEKSLIEKFKDFGSDKKVKDLVRVLRPATTKNSKNGATAKIILPSNCKCNDLKSYSLSPVRYELSDLANYFWGYWEEKGKIKRKKPKTKRKKIVQLKNLKTLHYNRAKDLETLVYIRGDLSGVREYLLFQYRLNLLYANTDPQKALELVLELNSKLTYPLKETEAISATKSAETNAQVYFRLREKYKDDSNLTLNQYLSINGAYIYRNSTIIKELDITQLEQQSMLILIDTEEKKRRKDIRNKDFYKENKEYYQNFYEKNKKKILSKKKNKYNEKQKADGKLSRAEQNTEIRKKIKDLMVKGLKQKEISDNLEISIATVKRHISYLRKNELI